MNSQVWQHRPAIQVVESEIKHPGYLLVSQYSQSESPRVS